MKQNIIILIIIIITIYFIWYNIKNREGFQTTSPVTSILSSPTQNTPDTCTFIKNIYEQIKAKYILAQSQNNSYLTDLLASSITEMEKNIATMGCT